MALFQSGSTTGLVDLLTKLDTFLTTGGAGNPGWTAEDVDGAANSLDTAAGEWAISKTESGEDCEFVAWWDTATPNNLALGQYYTGSGPGNYNNGADPWAQTGDSGNGDASKSNTTIQDGRFARITGSPEFYWCFAAESEAYAHVVVRVGTLDYIHFGFGVLNKFNDWTGGAYCYGYEYLGGQVTDVALQTRSTCLLDGVAASAGGTDMEDFVATLHIENMPNQPGSGLWAVHMGHQTGGNSGNNYLLGQDRQGTPEDRIQTVGGFRDGIVAASFGQAAGAVTTGRLTAYPIVIAHSDRDDSDTLRPLGYMNDVMGVNLRQFSAEDTTIIGSDTWHIFPTRRRGVTGALTDTTGLQGIMYKEN